MARSLDEIRADALQCRKCALCETRTTVVFGVGNPDAEVMFIGEAPGRQEDLGAEPFIGAAGKLLNRLLEMAGIPYAGSGVLSSACTMDKLVSKILANDGGIKQADYCAVDWFTFATQAASEIQRIEDKLITSSRSGIGCGIGPFHTVKGVDDIIGERVSRCHRVVVASRNASIEQIHG